MKMSETSTAETAENVGTGSPPNLSSAAAFHNSRTGDVFFMNRNCWAMKNPLAIGLCLLTKSECRFDHVGMLVKISEEDMTRFPEAKKRIVERSPSNTYVLETNMKGVTLFSAERRMQRSSANELAARTVELGAQCPGESATAEDALGSSATQLNHRMLAILEGMYDAPYQDNIQAILPSVFSPPDKMDRIDAAYKINRLQLEISALEKTLARSHDRSSSSSADEHVYTALLAAYKKSARELLDLYFPHLQRVSPTQVAWDRGHFIIDGKNNSRKMVCTELIGNLWLRSGITNGYVPASSLRPFDFFDDTRFNFTHADMKLGELVPLKVGKAYERFWPANANVNAACVNAQDPTRSLSASTPATEEGKDPRNANAHLDFYNWLLRTSSTVDAPGVASLDEIPIKDGCAGVPWQWVVQSNDQSCVRNLGARLFGVGVLFSFWAVPCAPLTLQWVEGQAGLFLIRGSVWSLTCGILARNLAFAAAQGLTAFALSMLVAAPGGSHGTLRDVMRVDGNRSTVCSTESSSKSGHDTGKTDETSRAGFVDWRHPYYSVAGVLALSSVVGHVATQPILNSVLSHHFGPLRAGPLPRKLLMMGAYSLAPFSVLLPMQGYFLTWYETAGSFVIPTRSSVLRPRQDLLERPDWPHLRNNAVVGAFAMMCVFDLLIYPFQTAAVRSLVRGLYSPQATPSIGRRFFPCYRYRLAGNLIISACTCASLSFIFKQL